MPSHTVVRELAAPVTTTFDVTVAEDVLPHVLHRWGPVPGVIGTRELTGPWDTPGSSRTVMLQDGNTARETLLIWERPRLFAYRVEQIGGPFGRLIDHAIGEWFFEALDDARSRFTWTYTFHPSHAAARIPLEVIARTAWAQYMQQCARLTVERTMAT